jgi:thiol-disulfide isomerase/thioredoxin
MVRNAIAALTVVLTLALGVARAGDTVLLDFASPTCGPCHQMAPTIQSLEQAGYPIRRVDITREPALAQQFGVSAVPCFVMLADGREVGRLLGGQTSRGELEQLIQKGRAASVRGQSPDQQSNNLWASANGAAPAQQPPRTAPPATDSTASNARPSPLEAQLITSSVRLKVDDPDGHSYGTGTIIDARSGEALVITCGHLFRDSKGKGPVMVEMFTASTDGVRSAGQCPGQVISYNLDRDIALVSIRPNVAVRVAPIASTQTIVERGHRVIGVGCNHGQDPTAVSTHVSAINRYQGTPNIEISGAPVEGRSGGGLFDDEGRLVGICFAADYEGNEGLYTALESIHDELDRVGLSAVYQSAGGSPQPRGDMAARTASNSETVIRGQEPSPQVMPTAAVVEASPGARSAAGPSSSPAAASASLSANEQAALEEIMTRASSSEVVCIVRPKDAGGKSEIITLNNVSPEFVRELAKRSATAVGTATR